jgi:hypothetical protein
MTLFATCKVAKGPVMTEHDSKYWRRRAAEARAKAEEMRDSNAKLTLLDLAASYDRIAERREPLAQGAGK